MIIINFKVFGLTRRGFENNASFLGGDDGSTDIGFHNYGDANGNSVSDDNVDDVDEDTVVGDDNDSSDY